MYLSQDLFYLKASISPYKAFLKLKDNLVDKRIKSTIKANKGRKRHYQTRGVKLCFSSILC